MPDQRISDLAASTIPTSSWNTEFNNLAGSSIRVTMADIVSAVIGGHTDTYTGHAIRTGADAFTVIKHNWVATTAPTVTDDSDSDYAVGSRWIDVTADAEYVCLDATVGAAVWTETTSAGGGTTFADNVFRVQDNVDATKEIAIEASAITTGTTRTITMPDANVDLTLVASHASRHLAGGADPIDAATLTARGTIELATQAEVDAGSDSSRAITPSTLAARPVAGMELTENNILIGNVSNNATEVGEYGASVAMGPPWVVRTASDPDETDDTYAEGWRWHNTANGKIWECVSTGGANDAVWRCTNVVVETDASTTAQTVDNTYDGSIKVYTGASAGLNLEVPADLNAGLSFEVVQWNANDPITVILEAASGVTINTHADYNPTTNGQFSSIVVTIIDNNDVLVRAGGADPV